MDFSKIAINRARQGAADAPGLVATFIRGDVTRLNELEIGGEFDLVLDIGCFHGIPVGRRRGYVRSVAASTKPGSLLLMFAFPMGFRRSGTRLERQIRKLFGCAFTLERVVPGKRPSGAAWFTLRRD